jgi:thiosulfate dehydrogenase [quinone] large subunit
MDRRQFLRGGVVAGLTLAVAAAAKSFAGPLAPTPPGGTQARGGAAEPTGPTGPTGAGSSGPSSVAGHTITTLDRLPVGQAIGFTAPGIGAAVVVRLANDRVVAYSRTCTHAGCLVGYDPSNRILFCPCHGAEFDPAHGAAPIAGPAPTALQTIPVVVDPATREVILPT